MKFLVKVFLTLFLLTTNISALEIILPGGALDEGEHEEGLYLLKSLIPFQDPELQAILLEECCDPTGLSYVTVEVDRIVISLPDAAAERYLAIKDAPPTRSAFEKTRQSLIADVKENFQGEAPTPLKAITFSQVQGELSSLFSHETACMAKPILTKEETVVDGKIFMKKPKLVQTQKFGVVAGGLCFLLFIGGVAAVFYFSAPLLFIPSVLPMFYGLYLTTSSYIYDPATLTKIRARDLQEGFRTAYHRKTIRYTLTPFERRELLIKEILSPEKPIKLRDYPIFYLANVYSLKNEILYPIFHPEEREILQAIIEAFVQDTNVFSQSQTKLEDDLMLILAHHQEERDEKLEEAREKFEQNPFAAHYLELKQVKKDRLCAVASHYKKKEINEDEKEEMIASIEEWFSAEMSDPELKRELEQANRELSQTQERILDKYDDKVQECKKILGYDEMMKDLDEGILPIYEEHNQALQEYVKLIPAKDSSIEDFLDLRNTFNR